MVIAMSAHYLGGLILAVGLAGLGGVNIWHGGPLDPRNDPDKSQHNSEDK